MAERDVEAVAWAREEFGQAELGDSRRTARVVKMARQAVQSPGGKISDVFRREREQQGAYDFLESRTIDEGALAKAQGQAAARRGALHDFVYVAIDGSSLQLADRAGEKDFGSVGSLHRGGRGLKVISALGVSPDAEVVGLFDQVWWARSQTKRRSRADKKRSNKQRTDAQKETRFWLEAIKNSSERANETGAQLWFQLDREADCRVMLLALHNSGHNYTVRANWNRILASQGRDRQYLRQYLSRVRVSGYQTIDVAAGPGRSARTAKLAIRRSRVELELRDPNGRFVQRLSLTAVWARESRTCPRGEKPLDWLLLTNVEVGNLRDAIDVVHGYARRWSVEEFHKTWKSGACRVEETQLRSRKAVVLWATILAAVATRIERLKTLSRTQPELPADTELSQEEVEVLILLKRDQKKRTEVVSDSMPTIAQATRWLADLGGYTGKSSGGPPGTITIRRGLESLAPALALYRAMRASEK